MLYLADQDVKAAIINKFKELKETIFKELVGKWQWLINKNNDSSNTDLSLENEIL